MPATYEVTCVDPASKESQTVEVEASSETDAARRVAGPGRAVVGVRMQASVASAREARQIAAGFQRRRKTRHRELERTIARGVFRGLFGFSLFLFVFFMLLTYVLYVVAPTLSEMYYERFQRQAPSTSLK